MTFERAFVLIPATIALVAAVLPKSGHLYRWGKGGNGEAIEPQWVGRLFFAGISALLYYFAFTKF